MVLDLVPLVVGLLTLTAAYKVVTLRRGFIPAQAALAAVFVALAIGVAPFAGVHTAQFGDTAAVRGWGDVAARVFITLAAGLAQTYLLLLAHPTDDALRRARPRVWLAGIVAGVLIVLGVLTPTPAFGSAPLDAWPEAAMHVAFLAYIAVSLGDVAISAARWARVSAGSMRVGLSLISAGAGCAIVYAVTKGVSVGLETGGGEPPAWLVESARTAALVGLTMVSIGCVLPAVARGVSAARHAARAHQLLDRLYPLWADLVAVSPGIALEPVQPRWRDRLHARDLDLRLYRRVIEIRDGQLALRTPVPSPADEERRSALRAVMADDAQAPGARQLPSTVDDEIDWWADVALAYQRVTAGRADVART